MEKEITLFKGELMEEQLRSYFLSAGYFVVRGVKYRYEGNDITDVDLFLYGRSSSLIRERINVDIKNKKTPQAFERVLWANGLMKLLKFDSCVVATTERKSAIHSFGQLQNTIILDGTFLGKLRSNLMADRITEEDLLDELAKFKSHKLNRDWRFLYELSKSRLLNELDYAGFNATVEQLQYFIDEFLTDEQKKSAALRMIYLTIGHLLITVDYIVKDIAFLEPAEREKRLLEGFTFGNLGRDGVGKIIEVAIKISGNKSAKSIMNTLEDVPNNILKDFFSKNDTTKNLFNWAKAFEQLAYKRVLVPPNELDASLKNPISIFLDYYEIERRRFFITPLPMSVQRDSVALNKSQSSTGSINLYSNNLITVSDVELVNSSFYIKIAEPGGKFIQQHLHSYDKKPIYVAIKSAEYRQFSIDMIVSSDEGDAPSCKLNYMLSKVTEFPIGTYFL